MSWAGWVRCCCGWQGEKLAVIITRHITAIERARRETEREQAREAGMRDFVAKPVEEAELLRVLAPLLRRG